MTEKLSKAISAWLDTPAWARAEVAQVPRNQAARALLNERSYQRELDALDTEMPWRMLVRRAKRIIDPVIADAGDTVAGMSASAALLGACDAGEPDEEILAAWRAIPPLDRDMLVAHAHMHAAVHVECGQKHRASTLVGGALYVSCYKAARAEEDIAAAFAAAAGILEAGAEERS